MSIESSGAASAASHAAKGGTPYARGHNGGALAGGAAGISFLALLGAADSLAGDDAVLATDGSALAGAAAAQPFSATGQSSLAGMLAALMDPKSRRELPATGLLPDAGDAPVAASDPLLDTAPVRLGAPDAADPQLLDLSMSAALGVPIGMDLKVAPIMLRLPVTAQPAQAAPGTSLSAAVAAATTAQSGMPAAAATSAVALPAHLLPARPAPALTEPALVRLVPAAQVALAGKDGSAAGLAHDGASAPAIAASGRPVPTFSPATAAPQTLALVAARLPGPVAVDSGATKAMPMPVAAAALVVLPESVATATAPLARPSEPGQAASWMPAPLASTRQAPEPSALGASIASTIQLDSAVATVTLDSQGKLAVPEALPRAAPNRIANARLALEQVDAGELADRRANAVLQSSTQPTMATRVIEAAAFMSDDLARIRMGERSVFKPGIAPASAALTAGWVDPGVQHAAHQVSASFAPSLSTPVPDVAIADKLNYWVTRGVQGAALQLDAFGGGDVKVNISVQGNEAVVEFRTDQPEARRLLQDAMPHLKEMLRSEGLLLSGGFVGSSGQQRDFGQQAQSDHGKGGSARETAAVASAVARPSPRLGQVSGRAVDLFV